MGKGKLVLIPHILEILDVMCNAIVGGGYCVKQSKHSRDDHSDVVSSVNQQDSPCCSP